MSVSRSQGIKRFCITFFCSIKKLFIPPWILPYAHFTFRTFYIPFVHSFFCIVFLLAQSTFCTFRLLHIPPFVHSTFCTFNLLYILPFVHSTFCTFYLLYIQPFVHSTFCTFHLLYIQPFVHSTFCTFYLLYIQPFVHSTFCTFYLLYILLFVHFTFCTFCFQMKWILQFLCTCYPIFKTVPYLRLLSSIWLPFELFLFFKIF